MEFLRQLGALFFLSGIPVLAFGALIHIFNNQPNIITWFGVALLFASAASYFVYDLNIQAD